MADIVPPGCERFDLELGELASGVTDPAELPALAVHLETCARCRLALDELSTTADRLALLGPELEPPPGFEARALTSFRAAQPRSSARSAVPHRDRRRRVLTVTLAAAAVAVVVGIGAVVLRSADRPDAGDATLAAAQVDTVRAAPLLEPDGTRVGSVVALTGSRTTYVMSLDAPEPGEVYRCQVVGADGDHEVVGWWSVEGSKHSWTAETDRPPAAGDRVQLVGEDGEVAATAVVPS